MKDLWGKIKRTFFTRRFLWYAIFGCLNTVNNIAFSALYSRLFQPNLAFVLAYISWLSISYLLNSLVTFRTPLSFVRYLKYCVSYVPNFLLQMLTVFIVYNVLGAQKIIAYAIAAVIGGPMTFIILKLFAFAARQKPRMNWSAPPAAEGTQDSTEDDTYTGE